LAIVRVAMARAIALIGCLVVLSFARGAAAQTDGGAPAGASPGTRADGGTEGTAPPASAPVEEGGGGLFEQSVAASSGTPVAGEVGAVPALPFTLNGYVRGDVFIGRVPGEQAAEMKAAYGELSLALRTTKSTYGDGFAELRVRHGLQGSERATFLNLREAYANTYVGPLHLRLGQQIIVWGRADALNPTNNLTPVDFRIRSPLEDDIRVGNIGARGFLRLPWSFRLEGVWMPVYLPTEIPSIGLPQPVTFGAPRFPGPDLRNGTGGARLHLERPSFEASVSYLYGYALMPGLTLANVQFDAVNPSVQVSRTAYDHQVVGADFSFAIGDIMTVRGEAAYRRPFNYQTRPYAARPDAQYVLGLDHNFGTFSVIGQYMGRYVFDWQREMGTAMNVNDLPALLMMNPDDWRDAVEGAINAELAQTSQVLFSQTARIQHIATLRFEWLLAHETLSISSLCLYNFTTGEVLVMPRIGYRFTDAVIAYVGGQVFHGPTDTLFGLIDQDLSAGYTELRVTF
jgi:hypothetical protein